jgi:hypothetical protein
MAQGKRARWAVLELDSGLLVQREAGRGPVALFDSEAEARAWILAEFGPNAGREFRPGRLSGRDLADAERIATNEV